MRNLLLCAVACASLFSGCSSQREDRLGIPRNTASSDPATAGDAAVTPPVPEPARAAQLGVSGGSTRSKHYQARILVSFPQGAGTSKGPHYTARLMRGAKP